MEQPDKIRFDLTRTAFGHRVRDNTFIFWRKCRFRPLPALERVLGWGRAKNPDCDASSRETCCLACRLPSPARSSAAQSKTAKWRACSSRRLGAGRLAATVALRSSHDRNNGCGRPLSIASRRSSASKPPSLHHVATSTCCLAAASNSHRNLRASSARAFSISSLATLFLFGRTTTDLVMLLVWVCPRGRGYTDEVRRTPPLGPRPLGQTLGAALDFHRIISMSSDE